MLFIFCMISFCFCDKFVIDSFAWFLHMISFPIVPVALSFSGFDVISHQIKLFFVLAFSLFSWFSSSDSSWFSISAATFICGSSAFMFTDDYEVDSYRNGFEILRCVITIVTKLFFLVCRWARQSLEFRFCVYVYQNSYFFPNFDWYPELQGTYFLLWYDVSQKPPLEMFCKKRCS